MTNDHIKGNFSPSNLQGKYLKGRALSRGSFMHSKIRNISLKKPLRCIRICKTMKLFLSLCGFTVTMIFVQPSMADDTALAKQMDEMNDAYKAMRRETDPAKGAELARTAQDAIVKGIIELPEMVKAMADGPEKAKASAEYRKMMGTLITTLADMELAFLNNDMTRVKEIIESMRDIKKQGHDQFMEE